MTLDQAQQIVYGASAVAKDEETERLQQILSNAYGKAEITYRGIVDDHPCWAIWAGGEYHLGRTKREAFNKAAGAFLEKAAELRVAAIPFESESESAYCEPSNARIESEVAK